MIEQHEPSMVAPQRYSVTGARCLWIWQRNYVLERYTSALWPQEQQLQAHERCKSTLWPQKRQLQRPEALLERSVAS